MRADEILKKRRDRAIAIVLNAKEREIDPLLKRSPAGDRASRAMRKAILDQFNDFCDLALDVASSSDVTEFEFNPEVWQARIDGKLEDIYRAVQANNGNHAA